MMESSMGQVEVPEGGTTSTNNTLNSTLLYICVGALNNKSTFKLDPDSGISPSESYSSFPDNVGPLDPNMSSVARYSPVYGDTSGYNNVIIHQLVAAEGGEGETSGHYVANLQMEGATLENTVLCSGEQEPYLEMVNGAVVESGVQPKQEQVEILITQHNSGLSYSVNGQEVLVEQLNDQLLDVPIDPMIDTELLGIDETTLKNNLTEELLTTNGVQISEMSQLGTSIITNYTISDNFCNEALTIDNDIDRVGIDFKDEKFKLKKMIDDNLENDPDETLLSRVYNIIEKPIFSRARATLPENYLGIHKLNDGSFGVFAKKTIPRRSQFGPILGVLKKKEDVLPAYDKLELLIVEPETGNIQALDVSDENQANWMSFIRRAENYLEQNLVLTQINDSLYFTVTKNIGPEQELRVGYSTSYAAHHNLHILEKQLDNIWPCVECSAEFPTYQTLQTHLDLHDLTLEVTKDENKKPPKKKGFKKKNKLANQNRTPREAYCCNLCSKILYMRSIHMLREHMKFTHNIIINSVQEHFTVIRNYRCEKCKIVFASDALFKIHFLVHAPDLNVEMSNFSCPACDLVVSTQKQLISHVSEHALPKNKVIPDIFHCPHCTNTYSLRERLQQHMHVHDPDESKPYQCKICKKGLVNNSALKCHIKTHYAGKNVYECPICKAAFDHVLKLKAHVITHCIDKFYNCPKCDKRFTKYSMIRKHIRAFHGDRNYNCPHCVKLFPTIDKLRMHLLRHSDHREFLCAECGKQFKRKDKLKEHVKRQHSEDSKKKVLKPKVTERSVKKFKPKVEPTDFHRFIYKCHICTIGFKRRGMLVNHLAKKHPDIPPDSVPELNLPILRTTRDYYCQYCDKKYKSSSKRKAHIIKNHPGAALPLNNRKQGSYPELPNPTYSETVGSVTTSPQNCPWCHKQYASKAKLLQHQRKKHTEKMINFEYCDNNSNQEANLEPKAVPPKPVSEVPTPKEENMEQNLEIYAAKAAQQEEPIVLNVMEEFVDDPEENTDYCNLVPINNDSENLENFEAQNTNLYRLLTTNNLDPPR